MFDNIDNFRKAKKRYYEDLANAYGPFRFFNTLSFQYLISDDDGRAFADIYWRRTSKKVFDRDRIPQTSSIHGMAVLEHASIRADKKGPKNCHFHFLIKDHPIFSPDNDIAIAQISDASCKASRNLKTFDGKSLVSSGGIDVRTVYSTNVAGYVLKDAGNLGWKRSERLFYLDREGLVPVCASPPNKMF